MAKSSSPFATFMIIGPTCFFLGMLLQTFPYDYYVLWAKPPTDSIAFPNDKDFYFTLLENHLKFLYASPPLISRILHIVIGIGLIGLLVKLWKPSEANMLFDGASLVLYMCGVIVYLTNIIKGLRIVWNGQYELEGATGHDANGHSSMGNPTSALGKEVQGREDTLRVYAASNTILALVLIGVLILQAGQWYAQKKEDAEIEEMEKAEQEKLLQKTQGKAANGDKKKQ